MPPAAHIVLVTEIGGCPASLATLDALMRLSIGARQCGFRVALSGASAHLRALIRFAGLHSALDLERAGEAPAELPRIYLTAQSHPHLAPQGRG